jgi:AMP deaminase
MNVSLSTDDPLMLHYTRNPLLEEYAVASQVYRLDPVDMAELARNSVLQSGFEYPFKARWVGEGFAWPGPSGSKIEQNNVPYTRLQYRLEVLREELHFLGVKEDQQPRVKENLAKKNVRISSG